MKLKHPAFILMVFSVALFLTACTGHQKPVTSTLKDTSVSPAPSGIIKDDYAFAYETTRCATTPQFLITSTPYSLSPPDKALKFNFQGFAPKISALPEPSQSFSVFFPKGSHILGNQEAKNLDRFIHDLKKGPAEPVNVSGYTCRLGPDDSNQILALNRARAVADYLECHGVSVASVTGKAGIGYISDTDPAQNRRVEITLSPPIDHPITNNQKGGGSEIEP